MYTHYHISIINVLHFSYTTILTSIVWFIIGSALYMNPFIAKIYKKFHIHPSMKHFSSQKNYFLGIFFIAGLIFILLTNIAYVFLVPISRGLFGCILFIVRIIPILCYMWIQTSYPNVILFIELINGLLLSFVITFMFSIL